MIKVWGAGLVCLLAWLAPAMAKDATNLTLAKGARVGVINLLDAEVIHYHAARDMKDSFLKTLAVNWPVDAMLADAVKDRMTQMGLVLVPLAATDALLRAREDCFLNATLTKNIPKECAALFGQAASGAHVDAIIVLGPGLNNSAHAGGSRRKDLPDYLRGWGIVSSDDGGKPALFDMTEMLLVGVFGEGTVLGGRQWGGSLSLDWTDFTAPPDLKAIPQQQIDQLQPLFASILSHQAGLLLDQLQVR